MARAAMMSFTAAEARTGSMVGLGMTSCREMKGLISLMEGSLSGVELLRFTDGDFGPEGLMEGQNSFGPGDGWRSAQALRSDHGSAKRKYRTDNRRRRRSQCAGRSCEGWRSGLLERAWFGRALDRPITRLPVSDLALQETGVWSPLIARDAARLAETISSFTPIDAGTLTSWHRDGGTNGEMLYMTSRTVIGEGSFVDM